MKFHTYFQYLYLFVAILFGYDAVSKYINNDKSFWISILFCAAAVFMFFLKQKFAKTYGNNKK